MNNFITSLSRNLSTRHIIINIASNKYLLVSVIQYSGDGDSITMIDNKKYTNAGFRNGIISSFDNASKDISEVICDIINNKNLDRYSDEFMGKTYVDLILPDKRIESLLIDKEFNLDGSKINEENIEYFQQSIVDTFSKSENNNIVLYDVILNWNLDGEEVHSPINLQGKKLVCYAHLIVLNKSIRQNFEELFDKKNLILNKIYPKVCMDLYTYCNNLSDRVLLLSMHEGYTTYSVIIKGDIVFTKQIDIGYISIIDDVQQVFRCDYDTAIKHVNENGVLYHEEKEKKISFSINDKSKYEKNESIDNIDKGKLYKVIFSRLYELFQENIKKQIHLLPRVDKICLINTNIAGIESLIEKTFDNKVEVISLPLKKYDEFVLKQDINDKSQQGIFAKIFNWFK